MFSSHHTAPPTGIAHVAGCRVAANGLVAMAVAVVLSALAAAAAAAPAPWHYWRSNLNGARVCAQTSPGHGWTRDSAAFEGPDCQPRRKVLVVPVR